MKTFLKCDDCGYHMFQIEQLNGVSYVVCALCGTLMGVLHRDD